jgi:CheY-like chemotaxis protein
VETGEEALSRIHRKPPAVALVDVDLPGMSGLDLVARLERLRPGIRAVLITAAEGDRIARFRREHPVDYIPKPIDFPRLLLLLNRLQRAH